MLIDTIMALWNHIWFSRLKKTVLTCFLLGIGVIAILTLVGLPAFSQSSRERQRTVQPEPSLPIIDSSIATQPRPWDFITPIPTRTIDPANPAQPFPEPQKVMPTNPPIQGVPVISALTIPFLPPVPTPTAAPALVPIFPLYPAQIDHPAHHTTQQPSSNAPRRPRHPLPVEHIPTIMVPPTIVPVQVTTPTATPVPVPTPGADVSPTPDITPIPVSPAPTPQDTIEPTGNSTSLTPYWCRGHGVERRGAM